MMEMYIFSQKNKEKRKMDIQQTKHLLEHRRSNSQKIIEKEWTIRKTTNKLNHGVTHKPY